MSAAAAETGLVTGLTQDGEGVVRGGKTAFVAGALPGERIRLRRTRRHRQHDDAELLEVLEPSGARVAPRCAHFGVCGGCALQHLAPAAQLAAKQSELAETLARVARVQPARWLAPLAGPVWAYRRRARLGVKFVRKKGCVVVGFRERAAPYVAQLTRCEVLAAPVGELIAPLAAMLTELSIRERVPQIEVAVADHATALVLRVLSAPPIDCPPAEDRFLVEVTFTVGRRFGVPPKLAMLLAVGTSVCGASAVVAAGSVTRAQDEEITLAVALCGVLGTAGVFFFVLAAHSQIVALKLHL